MDSSTDEIIKEIPGLIRVFKNGRCERFKTPVIVPAGVDPSTGVISKDVVFSPETNNFARLYIPKTTTPKQKLPLLVFYHGGAFIIESAASSDYHNFLNLLVAESNIAVVSVDYRLAPEFPLPLAYQDSWEAIKWVVEHAEGTGPEPWLNEYADLQNIFLGGDSAGGNIAHNMAVRLGSETPAAEGIQFRGAILLHSYFWGKERVGSESDLFDPSLIANLDSIWGLVHPGSSGLDDPLINPGMDPEIGNMVCSKMLVCIAGNDFMRERNRYYKQVVEKSGWKGELEVVEDDGEAHVFFLRNHTSPNACALRTRICTFINNT